MPAEKPLFDIFTAVPGRYDLINRVITLGLDRRWRRRAARECLASQPRRVLDLCCGTGDLAIDLARPTRGSLEITGIDFSPPMLEIAATKAAKSGGDEISFIHGDIASLPFPDGHFDCAGISFAFRNLTYRNPLTRQYLAEIRRVLAGNGRFVIVETSQPGCRLIRKLFHLYLRGFAFPVARRLSGNRAAYHYLADSASRFFTDDEVEEMLLAAGFRRVSHRPLFFGAAAVHTAVK